MAVSNVEGLLLAHESELPEILRAVIRVVRAEVEQRFPEATPHEHLLLGAAVLRMILVSIDKEFL